jgi:hypothetical protein
MRRRTLLAGVAGTVALAGCSGSDDGSASTSDSEALTPAPVPTTEPAPESLPPPDLSELGVEDAEDLARQHRDALVDGPHGVRRVAVVSEDGEPIRSMEVRIRATAGSESYYVSFEAEDTVRYPTTPAEPFFETWYDGTTYQRYGDDDYIITDQRPLDSPRNQTTDRFRIQQLFDAFSTVEVTERDGDFDTEGTDLRAGFDVTPRRFRLLSAPRAASLRAVVRPEPRFVSRYDLSMVATLDLRSVDVDAAVDFERLDSPPTEPEWVEAARETARETN